MPALAIAVSSPRLLALLAMLAAGAVALPAGAHHHRFHHGGFHHGGFHHGGFHHGGFHHGHGLHGVRRHGRHRSFARFHHHRPRHGVHFGFGAHGGGELALGVLAGAVLGYALSDYARSRPQYPTYPTYPTYPAYPAYPADRGDAPPAPREPLAGARPPAASGACLQEREYRTVIRIDGEPVEAWGIACLQADGAWRLGRQREAREGMIGP